MRRCLFAGVMALVILTTGCVGDVSLLDEYHNAKHRYDTLFQERVTMEKGIFIGTLSSKHTLGKRKICHYSYGEAKVSGKSVVLDTCPEQIVIERM